MRATTTDDETVTVPLSSPCRQPNWLEAGLEDDRGPRLSILMSSWNHVGRTQSLIAIACECIRRGHKVTMALSTVFMEKARALATGDLASQIVLVEVPGEGTEELGPEYLNNISLLADNKGTLGIARVYIETMANTAKRMVPGFKELLLNPDYDFDIIVADIQAFGLSKANEEIGDKKQHGKKMLPAVYNMPILAQGEFTGQAVQSGYYPANNVRQLYDSSFCGRLKNVVVRRAGAMVFNAIVRANLELDTAGTQGSIRYPVLVGSAFGFEVPHETPPHMVHTGPMVDLSLIPRELADADPHVLWARNRCPQGVFLVSLGTTVTLGKDELNSLAQALIAAATDDSSLCFLWSLKQQQQDLLSDELKQAIQDNDCFEMAPFVAMRLFLRWAPVVGVLTQGGIATVSESLYFGIPVVIMPFLFDQIDIAARVESANAGIDVGLVQRPHDPSAIRKAVHAVNTDVRYRHGAEQMGRLFRRAGGVRRAVDVVEDVLQFGNQFVVPVAYREDAPWYSHSDTDVVVFLTAAAICLLLAAMQILKHSIRWSTVVTICLLLAAMKILKDSRNLKKV